jgi:hypothetical protein
MKSSTSNGCLTVTLTAYQGDFNAKGRQVSLLSRKPLEGSREIPKECAPASSTAAQLLWAAGVYKTAMRRLSTLPPDVSYMDMEAALRHANEAFWNFCEVREGRDPVLQARQLK